MTKSSIAQPVQPADVATIARLMKSADRYAHVYSFVADDTMPKMRALLEADIRAALAQPVQLVKPVGTPLADAQLLAILAVLDSGTKRPPPGLRQFARAIEAAHGIKPASEGGAA